MTTKAGRGGLGTTLALAVLMVVVSVAAGLGLGYLIWGSTSGGGGEVVLGIRRLNELATVEQTVQAIVVEEESEKIGPVPLPDMIGGEKLLLVAVGEVEAGVDLDELEEDDVRVLGETVAVTLPEARVLDSSLDEDATKLYDRDRGLLKIQGNDELIEEARRSALEQIEGEAMNNNILEQAENNAEDSIRALVTSLGYEKVSFEG